MSATEPIQFGPSEKATSMLVGRETHVSAIDLALAQARADTATVTVLAGDPGSGKSTLLAHAAAHRPAGALLLSASGHEAESDLPYAGLHQLLSPVIEAIGHLPELQRQALSRALALESGSPGDELATASAVLRLITAEAETRPVVVIADDFQWLDPSTRQVLIFVARRIEADAVAMLLAHRGTPGRDLLALGQLLHVGPMTDAESRELLRTVHPGLSSTVARKVVERAAGLPLALIQIPAGLSEDQRLSREPLPRKLPVGEFVERLYQARLDALDDEARMALLIGSFEDLDATDLARALGHAGLTISALSPAERCRLVAVDDGRCVFTHPTVRGAVHIAATSAELLRAHEALAVCFADDPARYALYVQGCSSVSDDDVALALDAAALQAQEQGGFAEAANGWEAAAARTSSGTRQREFRSRAIMCSLRASSGRQALSLLATAIEAAHDELERAHWQCLWVVSTMWVDGGPPADSDRLIEVGIELLHGDDEHVRRGTDLLMALASCEFVWGAYGAGRAIADQLRAIVPPEDLPIGHRLTCEILDVMVGAEGAGAFLRTSWIDDIGPQHMADPSVPVGFSGVALGWLDDLDTYERVVGRCREMTAAHEGLAATRLAIGSMSVIALEREGRWDRALLEYAGAERVAIDGDFAAPYPYIALRRAYLLATQGKSEEYHELRERAFDGVDPVSPALEYLDRCVRGMLELTLGQYAQAADTLAEAGAHERRTGTIMSGLMTRFVDQFEAYWHLGRADELLAQLDEFTAVGHRTGHPTMLATAERCRALLVDDGDIDVAFGRVLALGDVVPHAFESARTHLLWGVRLRRVRRKRDARVQLLRAEHLFEQLDAVGWLVTTRSELAACGERRVGAVSGTAGPLASLTPREFEVAKAVAGGASNPAAAERLFISQRTVEYHLSNVYRKLQATDRTELARFFHAADAAVTADR